MAHTNKWEDRGLRRIFSGNITAEEVLKSNLAMHGDARFDDIKFILNDFTQIEGFEVSHIEIKQISKFDHVAALTNKKLKIIIVATDESLLKWIYAYIEQMQNSPLECVVFKSLDDAYNMFS